MEIRHNRKILSTVLLIGSMFSQHLAAQSLEQAVEATLLTEPQIAEAFHLYRANLQDVRDAKSGYLPSVDLQAGYGYELTNSPTTRIVGDDKRELRRGELSVSIRQKLFDGFAVMDNVQRTQFEATASQYALFGLAQERALKVAEVYLSVLETKKILQLSQRNFDKHQRVYEQIKERVEQGLGSSADLSQIEGRLARAKVNVISSEHNVLDAESRFVEVVNKPPQDLVWPVSDAILLPKSLDDALTVARRDHPVLLSAYSDIQAAGEQLELSNSNYYPKFTLELGASHNNNIDGTRGYNEDITAMLRMRYNLYSGGSDNAKKLKAAYLKEQSKDIYAQSMRQVIQTTKLSWRAEQFLKKQFPLLQLHVDSAKAAQKSYEEQFFLGKRSLLDLLDTSNEVFEARKTYTSVEHSQLFAQYRILAATGKLLDALRVEKPKQWSKG